MFSCSYVAAHMVVISCLYPLTPQKAVLMLSDVMILYFSTIMMPVSNTVPARYQTVPARYQTVPARYQTDGATVGDDVHCQPKCQQRAHETVRTDATQHDEDTDSHEATDGCNPLCLRNIATQRDGMRSGVTMPPPGLEPGTRGLRVRCSAS